MIASLRLVVSNVWGTTKDEQQQQQLEEEETERYSNNKASNDVPVKGYDMILRLQRALFPLSS